MESHTRKLPTSKKHFVVELNWNCFALKLQASRGFITDSAEKISLFERNSATSLKLYSKTSCDREAKCQAKGFFNQI